MGRFDLIAQGKSAKTPELQAAGMRGHLEKPSSTGGGSLAGRSHHFQGFTTELRHLRAFFGRPAAAWVLGSCFGEGTSSSAGSVVPPPVHLGFPPLALCDAWFADHPSNAAFSPFFFVIWQGDPIPEDIYEILGGGSVRSISDLQRALRIDSVGKSPLRQTLLLFL